MREVECRGFPKLDDLRYVNLSPEIDMSPLNTFVMMCLLAVALSGCGGGTLMAGDAMGRASMEMPGTEPSDVRAEYQLGSGDKLRVNVFGEDTLSGEYLVNGAGRVALPLIGEVPAAGLTVGLFSEAVAAKLRDGYINEPRVSAEVLNYRPFYILGEVGAPGTYPFTTELTVLNAVATAGGFSYRADQRRVFIRRAGQSVEREEPLTTTTAVRPGDTIRIGERFF